MNKFITLTSAFGCALGALALSLADNSTTLSVVKDSFVRNGSKVAEALQLSDKDAAVNAPTPLVNYVRKATFTDDYGIQLPFSEDFSMDDTGNYTIIDANGDGKTWTYNSKGYVTIAYNSSLDMDDWFITPYIQLEGGKSYNLSATFASQSAKYLESIEILFGNNNTVEALTDTVVAKSTVPYASTEFKGKFTAPTTGKYYVGFHGCSEKDMYNLYFYGFSIESEEMGFTPGAITDITIVPDRDGLNKGVVKGIAPTVTRGGDTLTEITKIEMYRGDSLITTFENPAPGDTLSFEDTVDKRGYYYYTFTPYNSYGQGVETQKQLRVGMDWPAAPTNAKVTEISDGVARLTWDASDKYVSGYPMNPSLVKYRIYDYTFKEIIADNVASTQVDFQVTQPGEPQSFAGYIIVPVNSALGVDKSVYAYSGTIMVGTNYTLPFHESFANYTFENTWGVNIPSGSNASWYVGAGMNPPYAEPQDGDDGLVAFKPASKNDVAILYSGKIDLPETGAPYWTFYYFAMKNYRLCFDAVISVDRGEWQTLKEYYIPDANTDGWVRDIIPLSEYNGHMVQIGYRGRCVYTTSLVGIDNINISSYEAKDLAVSRINLLGNLAVGAEFSAEVTVENLGYETPDSAVVNLYADDLLVATDSVPVLALGEATTVIMSAKPTVLWNEKVNLRAEVVMNGDQKADNNSYTLANVDVTMPNLPVVSDLALSSLGGDRVQLNWTAPEISGPTAEAKNIDFESYTSWSTSIDGWKFVDVDGGATKSFSGFEYPLDGTAYAYTVWDATAANLSGLFDAHAGNKYLMSFATASDTYDDWAISPELPGTAQTISFYARQLANFYADHFKIYYSTTDTNIENMTLLAEQDVTKTWTCYSYELPAGAKYFAIRHYGNDGWGLMIDDLSYTGLSDAPSEISGYNIYRDKVRINSELVKDCAYVDDSAPVKAEYQVSVVYGEQESALSAAVEYQKSSSINDITVAGNAVVAVAGGVKVAVAAPASVAVYDIAGRTVYNAVVASEAEISLSAGVYVVVVDGEATKIAVK
jgi:hypothetical protein